MFDVGANFWERLQSAHIHRCSQTNNNMDCFRLFIPNSIRKLQKKKSVSNGNELKKCMQQGNNTHHISTTQRYIDVNSDQLSRAVELL
jgi:hypothetical protein